MNILDWYYPPGTSFVHCFAYDINQERLVVYLRGGEECYVYQPVPWVIFRDLNDGQRIDSYYATYIRKNFNERASREYDAQIVIKAVAQPAALSFGAGARVGRTEPNDVGAPCSSPKQESRYEKEQRIKLNGMLLFITAIVIIILKAIIG